jgi:hypothetical protein
MIRHISLLTFSADTTEEWISDLQIQLRSMASTLDGLLHYSCEPDLGMHEDNAHFAVVAEFNTEEEFRSYRDLPEHRRILTEVIGPRLVDRRASQTLIER